MNCIYSYLILNDIESYLISFEKKIFQALIANKITREKIFNDIKWHKMIRLGSKFYFNFLPYLPTLNSASATKYYQECWQILKTVGNSMNENSDSEQERKFLKKNPKSSKKNKTKNFNKSGINDPPEIFEYLQQKKSRYRSRSIKRKNTKKIYRSRSIKRKNSKKKYISRS